VLLRSSSLSWPRTACRLRSRQTVPRRPIAARLSNTMLSDERALRARFVEGDDRARTTRPLDRARARSIFLRRQEAAGTVQIARPGHERIQEGRGHWCAG